MNDYCCSELKIDKVFKNLIPPLSPDEYKLLEKNLVSEGCHDPICVWNGIIIDGYNRYEICHKNKIPFKIHQIYLGNRNEVINWICTNQISRRNITEEARRYLIGKRYEAEKTIGIHNNEGKNQYTLDNEVTPELLAQLQQDSGVVLEGNFPHPAIGHARKTSKRIGDEYHLAHSTVEKYGAYSRAIDSLAESNKELTPKILSGQTKISCENVIELSKLPEQELKRISKQIIRNDRAFVGYAAMRRDIENRHRKPRTIPMPASESSVKDMPIFDPDAEISSLTLTMPSWISSINRAGVNTDFTLVSKKAQNNFISMLENLKEAAEVLLSLVKE